MILFDECIAAWEAALQGLPVRQLTPTAPWPDGGSNQMLFASDTAFELGGGSHAAVSGIAFTTQPMKDEILLYGPDLGEIKGDCDFARLTILQVDEETLGQGNAFYNALRKIEYTRYHVAPEGYMMRISSSASREVVRVGKGAVKKGIGFAAVGRMFAESYRQNPAVQAVKTIFVTDPKGDFKSLASTAQRAGQITTALDHLLKDAKMDCHTCSLQQVCAEVEDMLEKK